MYNIKQILVIGLALFFVSCIENSTIKKTSRVAELPFYKEATFMPHWLDANSEEADIIHRIPKFNLVNQLGEEVTEETFKDKIYIADFFFTTCPSICPILAKNMAVVQEFYKDDDTILLLSHTVMPRIDSVVKIKEYAIEKGAIDEKWHLITGDRDQIYNIARTSYFTDENFKKLKEESEFIHTENFILVDAKGRIRGVYNGTLGVDILRLKRHIKTLKQEL